MDELTTRETRAQEGIVQFAEEMQAIRDGNLYPGAGVVESAWGTYCRDRWDMSREHVDEIIRALPVLSRLAASPMDVRISTSGAAAISTLPEDWQDEILAETTKRDDVKKLARESRAIRDKDPDTPASEGVREAKKRVKAREQKKSRDSEMTKEPAALLAHNALVATTALADYVQEGVIDSTENEHIFLVVPQLKEQIERVEEKVYTPSIAAKTPNTVEEFMEIANG